LLNIKLTDALNESSNKFCSGCGAAVMSSMNEAVETA